MKITIFLTALTLTLAVHALDARRTGNTLLTCSKIGRYIRPSNDAAIKLAKHLNLKTCSSKRFLSAVKSLKATLKIVQSTPAIQERLKLAHQKKMTGKLSSFSF